MPFTPIWDAIAAHFFSPTSLSRVVVASQAEIEAEGWWKLELMWLLSQLTTTGTVQSWDRECLNGAGRQKVDFKIGLANTSALIEVKTVLCGPQKGQKWRLKANRKGGLHLDILKLAATQAPHRFLVVFAYAAPPRKDWDGLLSDVREKVRKKDSNVAVDLPRVDNSPAEELSIGWLQVT
ncbi:MAG TPA: hypothetical protein VH592_19565 [Gemmataceae bacterium]|jgi:hypothetical protein